LEKSVIESLPSSIKDFEPIIKRVSGGNVLRILFYETYVI